MRTMNEIGTCSAMSSASRERGPRRLLRMAGLLAAATFLSCNLNESGEGASGERLVAFAPRIVAAGDSLPEVDQVRLLLWLGERSKVRPIDDTIAWSEHEYVFERVAVGSRFTLRIEGLKIGMDGGTRSVWWSAETSGTVTASPQGQAYSPVVSVAQVGDMTIPTPTGFPSTDMLEASEGSESATISFTVPNDAELVEVAGTAVEIQTGGRVSVPVTLSAGETAKPIVVRIVDTNDNVWQRTLTVRRAFGSGGSDSTSPVIALLSPLGDTLLAPGATELLVRVRVSDNSGIRGVTIGGADAVQGVGDTTSWSRDLILQSGSRTVEIVATDKAGLVSRKSFAVTVPSIAGDVSLRDLGTTTASVRSPTSPDTVWQVAVPNRETELVLKPLAGDPQASISHDGKPLDATGLRIPLPPQGGTYGIVLVVRSADGDSVQGYLVQIEHQPIRRIELVAQGGRDQNVAWDDSVKLVAWSVEGSRMLGRVLIQGQEASCQSGVCSDSVKLVEGLNSIVIEASYRDTEAVWRDTLGLTRLSKPMSDDAGLVSFGPGIEAAQNGSDSVWVVQVSPQTRFLLVAPKAKNAAARIAIDGLPVAEKTLVFTPLGTSQDVVVRVTAEDGSRTVDYRLTVVHPPMPRLAISPEGTPGRRVTFGVTSATAAWTIPSPGWPLGAVTIDGAKVDSFPDGRYIKAIALPAPGTYRAILRAGYEGAGAFWEDTVTIERLGDDSIPTIVRGPGATPRSVPFDTTTTTASWSVTDNHKLAVVKIDGREITSRDGWYRIDLNLGAKRTPVVVEAWDSSNNKARDSIEIVRSSDNTNPVVRDTCLTTCPSVVDFTTRTYGASWIVTDNHTISSVYINDTLASVRSGIHSRTVGLQVGLNRIILVASDSSNNESRDTILVTRRPDVTPPRLEWFGEPMNGKQVPYSTRTITAAWLATDQDRIDSVTIGGLNVAMTDGLYERVVPLDPGANLIRIVARDASGLVARDSIVVFRQSDQGAPVIQVQTQARTVPGAQTSIVILCTATDAEDRVSRLLINNSLVSPTSGYYQRTIALSPGANPISIVAYDSSNNKSQQDFTILRDDQAPRIAASSRPASGIVPWSRGGTFSASWTLTDNHELDSVRIDGTPVGTMGGGIYTLAIRPAPGRNQVVLMAKDSVGNVLKDTMVFEGRLVVEDTASYRIHLMPDGKVWMGQNLRTLAKKPPASTWGCSREGGCEAGGRYYFWNQAMNIDSVYNERFAGAGVTVPMRGLCPDDWHIPDENEWHALFISAARAHGFPETDLGGTTPLKSSSGWRSTSTIGGQIVVKDYNGTNKYDDFLRPTYGVGYPGGQQNFFVTYLPAESATDVGETKVLQIDDEATFYYSQKGEGHVVIRCVAD